MFGYRARIGYISPSVIELNGYDFYRIVPDGVSLIAVACMVAAGRKRLTRKRSNRSRAAPKNWRGANAISSFTAARRWC